MAAVAPITVASIGAAPAIGSEGIPRKRGSGRLKGSGKKAATVATVAPSPARRCGLPPGSKNKKTLAALAAIASGSVGPSAAASSLAGLSRLELTLPALQPSAYTSAEGWSTFIVPVLAGAKDRLRLPSQFMEAMEGQEMAYAMLQECSVGQPRYRIEVYYDGEGECYFRDGWPKFFADYGVHAGWFLLFTRHDGRQNFVVCIFDGTLCARTFIAWS
jgi:hypothetical protein